MSSPLPCSGSRITLRRLSLKDLPAFQSYRHDEEVGRYQGWLPQSDDEAAEFLGRMGTSPLFPPGDWIQLAIADRTSHRLIGDIGLCVRGEVAEIGFTLEGKSQRQGLASEAVARAIRLVFEGTPVVKIVATTDARNLPSIRLLERVGMTRISTQGASFRGGECVEHTYEVARHEWIES